MRFEIVIDDEDRMDPGTEGKPWNAAIFPIADDGESGDLLAAGVGATPQAAVADLLTELRDQDLEAEEDEHYWAVDKDSPCPESEDGRHYVSAGSCDLCGAKNFS